MTSRIVHQSALGLSAIALALTASASWAASAPTVCTDTEDATITVIVASNFYEPIQALLEDFVDNALYLPESAGAAIKVCHNSTGLIVQEINTGTSPYSLFLAANNTAPAQIDSKKATVIGDQETYALGIPVLWSETKTSAQIAISETNPSINKEVVPSLAIGNPSLAPYGKAAEKILTEYLHQWETPVNPGQMGWITQYDNIALTLTAIGNPAAGKDVAGFVSKAQVCNRLPPNSVTLPGIFDKFPPDYYLVQDGILISQSDDENAVAAKFFEFLLSMETQRKLYRTFCYASRTYDPDQD